MKCKNCNAESPDDSRFCSQCGMPFAGESSSASNEPSSKSATASGAWRSDQFFLPYAERRQISIMFSDIIGSTELSENLDPEDLLTILRDYQAACSKVIALYEGYLAKYLGDGILAYFGYPTAHEDDARRAIQAGLGIIEAMGAIRERFLRETGVQVDVRVAIHTGVVVVGNREDKDELESYAIVGNAPNLAARIQSAAEPNTLIVSSDTLKLTYGFFEAVDYGTHELKGISQAVKLYRIIHESTARSRLDAASGQLTPLAGRDEELQTVMVRWHRAEEGSAQVVFVCGEAGIGKSRLLLSLKERASNDPESWLTELRCSPFHQNSSFYPIIDFLEHVALKFEGDDTPSAKLLKIEGFVLQYGLEITGAVPLIASLLSVPLNEQYKPLALTPQRQRQKTIELLVSAVLARASRQPMLFAIEDIHWIDPSSLEMLGQLIARAEKQKILIFLTYRPQFMPPWPAKDNFTKIELLGLSKKNAAEVIRRVAGNKDLPQEAIDHIVAKTDCVPLFLEELTKTMLESDMIVERNGRYELAAPLVTLGIPSTLQNSLTSRLDRMRGAKVLAQLGATIGREFTYQMLRAIPGVRKRNLRAQLGRLVQARILYQRGSSPNESYMFKHALIQESAYSSLLRSHRRNYHKKIADTIEKKFTEVAEAQPELLAQHYTEALQSRKALQYWLMAGVRALQRSANAEAISHLRRGLALIDELPDAASKARFELQLQSAIGPALIALKGFGDSEVGAVYHRAAELSAQLGEGPHLFTSLWGQWVYHLVRDDLHKARSLALEMKNLGEVSHDSAMLVEAHWTLGNTLFWLCELDESRLNLEKAIEIYEPQRHHIHAYIYGQDPGVAAHCYAAYTYFALGFPDKAVASQQKALQLAESLKHPFSIGWALAFRFMIDMFNCDPASALEAADKTIAYCTEQAYLFWLFAAMIVRGWAISLLEDPEKGIPLIEKGLDGWKTIGSIIVRPIFLGLLSEAKALRGDLKEAVATVDEGIHIAEAQDELISKLYLDRIKGELLRKCGSMAEAETILRDTMERCTKLGARSYALAAAVGLADVQQDGATGSDGKQKVRRILATYTEGFENSFILRAERVANA
jgi:class 3 adenylate cyclase/tetratricopeptide (TPR) repeat protein